MKKLFRIATLTLTACAALCAFSACGNKNDGSQTPTKQERTLQDERKGSDCPDCPDCPNCPDETPRKERRGESLPSRNPHGKKKGVPVPHEPRKPRPPIERPADPETPEDESARDDGEHEPMPLPAN